jgi:serine/threonine protein kinase
LTQEASDANHWAELQTLFDRFVDQPKADRERALEQECPDPYLKRRLLELLRANATLESTTNNAAKQAEGEDLVSRFIGAYRLVREIGRGGVGAVYLAERLVDGVCLRAALKILAPHAVDPAFVERFYREQQNLALLDHPNITRLLDVGWSEGSHPYLVMEYVDGVHLDGYCDARKLGIEERLGFFLQICDAVSCAHRNLIVHLDLKPSNILVSEREPAGAGTVKLLDFGTSKLIRADGDPTSTLMATPAYASPEQLLNQPVSTASDVYGLGSILYELLTGRTPFGKVSAPVRMEAAMREAEPDGLTKAVTQKTATERGMTLKRLRQVLRGDLSAIVAACLRSRPRDRYPSVDALSEEIRRYLSQNPVRVRRQTLLYTAGKFVRRHRLPVAVACGVALTVVASVGYAWAQQRQALHDAERSVRMQTFLFSLFKMANPNYTGKPVATVPEFLRAGMAKLPDTILEPSDLRAARLALAESMYESGDYAEARAALGQIIAAASAQHAIADQAEAEAYAGAIEYHQGNSAAARALTADAVRLSASPDVAPRVRVLSRVFFAGNEDSAARSDYNLNLLRAAVKESRERRLDTSVIALALNALGSDLDFRGDWQGARLVFQEVLGLYALDPLALCERSEANSWLAWIDDKRGEAASSEPLYRQSYEGYVTCAGADSRGALSQLPYWANVLIKTGRAAEAVPMLENALPSWRRVQGNDPEASGMLFYLARAYNAVGRFADAERLMPELMHLMQQQSPPNVRALGMGQLVWGQSLYGQQRFREALPHARDAREMLSKEVTSSYGRSILAEASLLEQRDTADLQKSRDLH